MKQIFAIALCITWLSAALAQQPSHPVAQQQIKPVPIRPKPRNLPVPAAVPASIAVACTQSRSQIILGRPGLGCRESPPNIWTAQGCPTDIGCCSSTNGCLVTSPNNSVRGD